MRGEERRANWRRDSSHPPAANQHLFLLPSFLPSFLSLHLQGPRGPGNDVAPHHRMDNKETFFCVCVCLSLLLLLLLLSSREVMSKTLLCRLHPIYKVIQQKKAPRNITKHTKRSLSLSLSLSLSPSIQQIRFFVEQQEFSHICLGKNTVLH